jgi:hypothetical protein
MNIQRTQQEVDREIEALKSLRPLARWRGKTTANIRAAIDELEGSIDRTAGEWNEMSDDVRQCADDAESLREVEALYPKEDGARILWK